jgi:hypothetical protein
VACSPAKPHGLVHIAGQFATDELREGGLLTETTLAAVAQIQRFLRTKRYKHEGYITSRRCGTQSVDAAGRTNIRCSTLALIGQLLQQHAGCGHRCQRLRRVSIPIDSRQLHAGAQQALDNIMVAACAGQVQATVAAVVDVTCRKPVLQQQPHNFHVALCIHNKYLTSTNAPPSVTNHLEGRPVQGRVHRKRRVVLRGHAFRFHLFRFHFIHPVAIARVTTSVQHGCGNLTSETGFPRKTTRR